VVEVAVEFIESMNGREMFVAVTEMILTDLAGAVAEVLHEFADARVLKAQSKRP
jgi:hypothetical protein